MSGHVSKGRAERTQKIEDLKKLFSALQGGVLTDYRGLKVAQLTELRRRLRAQKVSYRVLKNTLVKKALKGTALEDLSPLLEGPTGFAIGAEDPIAPARISLEFAKDNEALKIKGGFITGKVLTAKDVTELSKLPGMQGLRAQFLFVLNAPAQQLLGVFNGAQREFLGVLDAQARKLEKSA